jgi:SM-20-related protein
MSNPMPDEQHALDTLLDEQKQEQIIAGLTGQGWCVIPDFIPDELVRELQQQARHYWQQDAFRQAGVGQAGNFAIHDRIRTDRVMWLDPVNATGGLRHYLDLLDELKWLINRTLYLGLIEYEGHVAFYPPGTYYRKHLDQFQGDNLRTVTAILYLNDDWYEADGGQLRIYTDVDQQQYQEILPHAGQLVTFLSAHFVHEVMPANRERLSITGWFKQRGHTVV